MDVETIQVNEPVVACDGGGPAGHPRVFLDMEDRGEIVCPYCSRRYVLKPVHGSESGGT
ncbi:MAG: zinc-finger domain-containing protein [Alphaproteobacteria bacterium]|nr:zinc-finger domain-containing protein [Alphaproteobacteria bacterium]